jgi:hypothetical protein
LGNPEKNAIAPQKGDEKFPLESGEIERGVKGMLPLGCLPRWGREGVSLTTSSKCKKYKGSKRISPEQIFPIDKKVKRRIFFIKNYFKSTAIPQVPQNLVVSLRGLPQLLQVFPSGC